MARLARLFPGSRVDDMIGDCKRLATYPQRRCDCWILNVTSHVEWYREHDMDVHLIIVGCDASVSRKARQLHCGEEPVKLQEEAALQRLMSKAMTGTRTPAP